MHFLELPLRWADRQYLTQHGPCPQNRFILWMMLYSHTLLEKPLAFLTFGSAVSCWGSGSARAVCGPSNTGLWLRCPFWQRQKLSRFTWALLEGLPSCRWALSSPGNIPRERWWKHLLVHPDCSRQLPCVPRDGTTPKSLLWFVMHAGYNGSETSENPSEFPLVHSVPCSGTTQICAKRQFRLGKGYAIFLYLCFLSHFVKHGHVACNEDICSFCRKLWKSVRVCLVPSVAILINSWKLWQT